MFEQVSKHPRRLRRPPSEHLLSTLCTLDAICRQHRPIITSNALVLWNMQSGNQVRGSTPAVTSGGQLRQANLGVIFDKVNEGATLF